MRTPRLSTSAAARTARFIACVIPLLPLSSGCEGLRYLSHLVDGQLKISTNIEPVDDVLASGRLTAHHDAKLRLIVAARQFAIDHIGLDSGPSYTRFYDTGGNPLIHNLSAARKNRLEAYNWVFPIAGAFPYLGFFDESYLREVERDLLQDGYDTFVYAADAYSTLGILEDPVRSPMLQRDIVSLADTIIHELLHNTIWRPNDIDFNETMATFVGHQGAIEFFNMQYDQALGLADYTRQKFEDDARVNVFLAEVYNELEAYYRGPGGREEKIAGREAVFQRLRDRFAADVQPTLHFPEGYAFYRTFPTNNAWVLALSRYTYDLAVYNDIYDRTGRNWPATLAVFRQAAGTSGNPVQYLRAWLADAGNGIAQ